MKSLSIVIAAAFIATGALADPTCKAAAADKKLAGAALILAGTAFTALRR